MKHVARLLAITVLLLCARQGFAQDQQAQTGVTPTTEVHAGIGVSLTPMVFAIELFSETNAYNPLTNIMFHVPIEFGEHFRFEPEFGFVSRTYTFSYESGTSTERWIGHLRLGAGLFYLFRNAGRGNNLTVALGVRLAHLNASEDRTDSSPGLPSDESSWSRSDFLFAGCLGVEYYVAEDFSFGGEIQYIHYSYGDEDVSPATTTGTSYENAYTNINGMITLRWFIW